MAISEDTCLAMHEQETAKGLDAIKGCVEEVKDTLNRIEGFENPCGMGWTHVIKVDYTDPLVPCPGFSQKNVYTSPGCSRDLSEFRAFTIRIQLVDKCTMKFVEGSVPPFLTVLALKTLLAVCMLMV